MAQLTYVEKLKNPLWQRKRLEILQRDNFRCTEPSCFEDTKTLHVHHLDYIKGKEPWDYPNEYFTTLCEDCHEELTKERKEYESQIIHQFRLKLKESFIQGCFVKLLEKLSSEDLSDIIFMLWELKDDFNLNEKITEMYQDLNKETIIMVQNILAKKEGDNG